MPKSLFSFYWEMLKKYKWYAISMTLLGLIWKVWTVSNYPYLMSKIYSIFDYKGPDFWEYVKSIMIIVLAMIILPKPISMIRDYFSTKIKPRIRQKIREKLYDYVYSSDYKFFLEKNVGQIQSQVGNIYSGFHDLTIDFISKVLGIIIGICIIFTMLKGIDLRIAIYILVYGFIIMIWNLLIMRKTAKLSAETSKISSKLNGTISDSVTNFQNIKIFSSAKYEQDYIKKDRDEFLNKNWKYLKFNMINNSILWIFMNVCWVSLILFCAYLFYNKQINVAGFALVLSAWNRFEFEFISLGGTIKDSVETFANAKQAWGEIMVPQSIKDKASAKDLVILSGAIELKNIQFRYHKEWVVNGMTLDIKPGQKVGVVGKSGAGKTTLSHLLLRLFDVEKGGIFIDGQNIKNVRQESLREKISFVPQEPVLFNRTIFENIAYGKPDATKHEIENAARLANIHEFIIGTEKKYETVVGNRGIKLSGGQKQRIAIARAILKGSKILILDEATSALDSETENSIQSAFDNLMRHSTTIVIAHRLSTLKKMDKIIVMDKGKIAEQGSHAALLKKDGIYAKMWKMQSGGFIA